MKKNKYQREIKPGVYVDVYDVLNAYKVACPATQHAIKKLLAPGQRGQKDAETDLKEAKASIERAIELNIPTPAPAMPPVPPWPPAPQEPSCKGSITLGNACFKCHKCETELQNFDLSMKITSFKTTFVCKILTNVTGESFTFKHENNETVYKRQGFSVSIPNAEAPNYSFIDLIILTEADINLIDKSWLLHKLNPEAICCYLERLDPSHSFTYERSENDNIIFQKYHEEHYRPISVTVKFTNNCEMTLGEIARALNVEGSING